MQGTERQPIPYYQEINDFLASIHPEHRTANPLFYCLRLHPDEVALSNYKPPFRKDFYFIALVTNAGKTQITYDNTNVTELNSFLVFQAPGLIYSFFRDNKASGYLIYFKKECFSFFKPDFDKEFPFFHVLHTHFFKLNQERFNEFAPHFEAVFKSYESSNVPQHKVASVKLLALLYELKEFTAAFSQWQEGFTPPRQMMLQKFIQLVNTYYIEKRTIEAYAEMLRVTPNHLSQTVKEASGKNALSFISERLMQEARSLVLFTDYSIAEIAYRLDFTDPANFGRFFKKHTGVTPLDFRKKGGR